MNCAIYFVSVSLVAQQSADFYSVEKERALGQQYASEIRRRSEPLADASVQGYVDRIGGELVARLTDTRWEYAFEVISGGDWTEPFSLPGGYVFIPARSFITARDESEFAGMLAHAIGHVELRHGTRTVTRGQLVNSASIPLVFMGGWIGLHAYAQNMQILVPVSFLEIQRTYELEADRFGLELSGRAGYDPSAFLRYVDRTHPPDSKTSPLPARDLRLARIQQIVAALPAPARSTPGDDFAKIRELVRSIIERPKQRRIPTLGR
jgi:predicted Zn-dependent protease